MNCAVSIDSAVFIPTNSFPRYFEVPVFGTVLRSSGNSRARLTPDKPFVFREDFFSVGLLSRCWFCKIVLVRYGERIGRPAFVRRRLTGRNPAAKLFFHKSTVLIIEYRGIRVNLFRADAAGINLGFHV